MIEADGPRRSFPMFPLGTVLFPSLVLPLHIFEPRYRELAQRCTDTDGEFGVVLISRGSEVGGGESRFEIGTRARIVESEQLEDGRWIVVAVGVNRIKVDAWLPDDPFPRADVCDLDDFDGGAPPGADEIRDLVRALRQLLAMRTEMGDPAPPATMDLTESVELIAYQAAALAAVGPADAQRLLETRNNRERVQRVTDLLRDELDVLALRLSGR